MIRNGVMAPELTVAGWLNTPGELSLQGLRGRVVVLHAFQMLCPGCVSHGLPQAVAIHELYPRDQVQVIGLHTVFEHHQVMTADALKVFAHEYRLPFPIAIDLPAATGPIPVMMQKLNLRGTPSLVLIDKAGTIRFTHLGPVGDMQVGNMIGQLLMEGSG
ncbi:redoxin family protein [Marinobacter sp. X15-166B]|uniref:redoxin family protein n=1 Tax=Marinobacter sp. X15-166B TaxID=1897620 RepID=UPI00085C281C|nr:redoxin family protein [Marinobacter sp. X15-166B]OEY67292.1 alkyl hydroperoxide reductase [Marinobacter sp. X15-166B]